MTRIRLIIIAAVIGLLAMVALGLIVFSSPGPKGQAAWRSFTVPLPRLAAKDSELEVNSVACASPVKCVAIGGYLDPTRQWQGLLLVRRGATWKSHQAPAPSDVGSGYLSGVTLYAVACSPSSACTAVGEYADAADYLYGAILSQTGSTWTAIRAPLPIETGYFNPRANLITISCPTRSTCVAGGRYADAADNFHYDLISGSGISWTPVEMPIPKGADPKGDRAVEALACPGSICYGDGEYSRPSHYSNGLLLTGSRSSWTVQAIPRKAVPGLLIDQMTAIACTSPTSCVMSGEASDTRLNSTHQQEGFLIVRTRGRWKRVMFPAPSPYLTVGVINNVSCESQSFCLAAYSYDDIRYAGAQTVRSALIVGAQTRASWTLSTIPTPRRALKSSIHIDNVDCLIHRGCIVIGRYKDVAGSWHGLVLTRSGSRWYSTEITLPEDARDPSFDGVTCATSKACVAVGTYTDSSGNLRDLIAEGPI